MYVVHESVVDGSGMVGFPLVILIAGRPGIEPGQIGWDTSNLTTQLQELSHVVPVTRLEGPRILQIGEFLGLTNILA